MEKKQAIQAKILQDIKRIEGGWVTLARQMNCTDRALQKVMAPGRKGEPRLATLERISEAVKTVLALQETREDALL